MRDKKYICYETSQSMTKKEWYQWFKQYGDKAEWESADDWWADMCRNKVLEEANNE